MIRQVVVRKVLHYIVDRASTYSVVIHDIYRPRPWPRSSRLPNLFILGMCMSRRYTPPLTPQHSVPTDAQRQRIPQSLPGNRSTPRDGWLWSLTSKTYMRTHKYHAMKLCMDSFTPWPTSVRPYNTPKTHLTISLLRQERIGGKDRSG